MLYEGRINADYADDREVHFQKVDIWSSGKEMKEVKADKLANEAVAFFERYTTMGFPYGPAWAENPNPVVEVVEMLSPLHDIYRPRLI